MPLSDCETNWGPYQQFDSAVVLASRLHWNSQKIDPRASHHQYSNVAEKNGKKAHIFEGLKDKHLTRGCYRLFIYLFFQSNVKNVTQKKKGNSIQVEVYIFILKNQKETKGRKRNTSLQTILFLWNTWFPWIASID